MKVFQSLSRTPTAELPELAQHVEALGFDGISLSDHLVRPASIDSRYPYSADGRMEAGTATPYPDCWVTIAALAQKTGRVRFLSSVYVLPMRDPFTVAKAVSTAAVLSGERLMLGVGLGWMAEEFALTGQRFESRGRRGDEMLEILAKLFTGEMIEHRGEFYAFAPLQMQPVPCRPPPFLVGGHSDSALRRAARNDGWIGVHYDLPEALDHLERVRKLRREAGRSNDPFEAALALQAPPDGDAQKLLEDAGMTILLHPAPWPANDPISTFADRRDALERAAARLLG